MKSKEYVDDLDKLINQLDNAIEKLEKAKKDMNELLKSIAEDGDLKQCKACEEYVPEDYIVDFYNEDICLDCRGNGYGE